MRGIRGISFVIHLHYPRHPPIPFSVHGVPRQLYLSATPMDVLATLHDVTITKSRRVD
jgi:hypothetical protein